MKITGILCLLLLTHLAYAGEVTLTWASPTQQENCTNAGPLEDLTGYRIFRMVAEILDPAVETYTESGLPAGDHRYTAVAFNSDGESRTSPSIVKAAAPMVTVDAVVYTVIKQPDRFVLLPAGEVPIDTPCDEEQSINGHYVVPNDAVLWYGTVEPVVVVGQCS